MENIRDALEFICNYCAGKTSCFRCVLFTEKNGGRCSFDEPPEFWNINRMIRAPESGNAKDETEQMIADLHDRLHEAERLAYQIEAEIVRHGHE